MNYLKEINAFMDWLEINPLDATTQALWFHIMAIANKSGWPEWFTIANLTLMAKVGISENTLIKHRNILIQKNRIEYKNQGKHKAGKYRIIPFTSFFEVKDTVKDNLTSNFAVNHEANCEVNHEVKREVNPSALNKLNKTKQNNNNNHNNARENFSVFAAFEQEFGRPLSPMEVDRIRQWCEESDSMLIMEALRRAVMMGKMNFRYIDAILLEWRKNNLRTLSEVAQYDQKFQEQRTSRYPVKKKSAKKEQPLEDKERQEMYNALLMS